MSTASWTVRVALGASLFWAGLEARVWAQSSGKGARAAEPAPSLVDQASAAYDANDYARALDAARTAVQSASSRDPTLPLQIWVRSAEELGDLGAMAAGLDTYAHLPDLGQGSARFIDAARLRLAFYDAERSGRISDAEIALKSAGDRAAGSEAWQEAATARLEIRRAMAHRDYATARSLSASLADFPGATPWLRTLRAELAAADALSRCDLPAVAQALTPLQELPLVGAEQDRLEKTALYAQIRMKILDKDVPGARASLTALENALTSTPGTTTEDQSWLDLYRLRVDLDEAWENGHRDAVTNVRDHYAALQRKVSGEPGCMEPDWMKVDLEHIQELEEARQRKRRAAGWMFAGAGVSAVAAGAMSGLTVWSVRDYEAQVGDTGTTFTDALWSSGPGQRATLSRASAITSASLGLASASLLTVGLVVRW